MEERRKRGGHRERAEGESVLISRATKRRIAYSGRRRKKPKRETIFLLFSLFVAGIVEARRGSEEG